MKKKISFLLASFFGSGYIHPASGTWGSFASFIAIVPVAYFYGMYGVVFFSLLSFIIGWLSTRVVLRYTEHDPSFIVIDETAGQTITFLFVANMLEKSFSCWYLYLAGFILFRLFDITKPSIIGIIDRKLENPLGVMLDDIFAGIFAGLILFLVNFII